MGVQDHITGRWTPTTVVEKSQDPRSYIVETQIRGTLGRNRRRTRQIPQTEHPFTHENPAEESTETEVDMDQNEDNVDKAPGEVPQEQESTHDGTRTRYDRTIKKPGRLNL